MNATHYFALVDEIAHAAGPGDLALVRQRIALADMHPLERRVLERAVRARAAALVLGGTHGAESTADAGPASGPEAEVRS